MEHESLVVLLTIDSMGNMGSMGGTNVTHLYIEFVYSIHSTAYSCEEKT